MAQEAPLSIRVGDFRLAKIDAYAVKHGIRRHAAVLELLDVGLYGREVVATQRPTPKPVPGSDRAASVDALPAPEFSLTVARVGPKTDELRVEKAATSNVHLGPVRQKPGARLKGKK